MRSQSAMEYLMTYGWAILAIAIVMVSLYSLGIFNTGSLQPTATPGSCEVVRTAAQTSLAGQCSNLIPKYVGQFNGQNSYISITSSKSLQITSNITIVAWINPKALSVYYLDGLYQNIGGNNAVSNRLFYQQPNEAMRAQLTINGTTTDFYGTSSSILPNRWYQVAYVFNGLYEAWYVNGKLQATSSQPGNISKGSGPQYIGSGQCCSSYMFNGSIADVQIYNASLDNASIRSLYQEGIGGVPIDVKHIVGWWPLNGNANDYSSNNNHGTPANLVWNANWQSGYSSPTT